MAAPQSGGRYRFLEYDLDVPAYELRRDGRSVRLERQPMDLLILLVERRRQLVSRAEIVDRLWGSDVFVDVETGVHTAIRKVRQALRDSPSAPAFVETVPGRGYRFIAPVEVVVDQGTTAEPSLPLEASSVLDAAETKVVPALPDTSERTRTPPWKRLRVTAAASLGLGLLTAGLIAGVAGWARWSEPPAVASSVRLAVLPFANLSGDPSREYIADGLTEETIASLGQANPDYLSVIARTSTLAYKGSTQPVSEIGRTLGADYLLESSIRVEASRLRITSRLIRVRDAVQVWSESYDREPTSLLGLQQELSAAIASQIRVRLLPDDLERVARRQPRSPDAYDLYLRGRNFELQRTAATNRQAIEYYERATAVDPDYALAWSGLAFVHASSPINSEAPPLEVCPRAREAAMQAVRADANLAEAQLAAGYVRWMCDWDWPDAEAHLRRAVALDSRLPIAHHVLGHILSQMGRHGEALPAIQRARELDPMSAMMHAMSSQLTFQARDYVAALDHARQALVVDPEFWIGYIVRAQAYQQLGRTEPALEALTLASRFSGRLTKTLSLRGYVLARAGRLSEARDILKTLADLAQSRYVPPSSMAMVSLGLDDRDAAFTWLDRAYAARDVHLIFLPVDPKWDTIRKDPRFVALLAACGFSSGAATGLP